MAITLRTPDDDRVGDVVNALRSWQRDGAPVQLHPGDLGWAWRLGAPLVAAAVRTWDRGADILAIGLLDGPDVLRMTVAPQVWRDEELATRVVEDVSCAQRGVLPRGKVSVEVPNGTRVQSLLAEAGWSAGMSWTPLRLDLAEPVQRTAVRVEVVGPERVSTCTAVHRSAWGSPLFTDDKWRHMAAGLPFADARCLVAHDERGAAVATVTAWSAGPGKPGLVEPLGVHVEHRRRGHGSAIVLAAAAELRQLGSSSVLVCTPTSLGSAISTYEAAGFERLPGRLDRSRDA